MLARFAHRFGQAIGALIAAVLVAMAFGCLVPDYPEAREGGPGAGRNEILILSSAIHTDIALPATSGVRERFAFLEEAGLPLRRPDVAYVVAGWGGRSFYIETPTWADLKPGPVVASFTRDASVMHMELAGAIGPDAPGVRAVTLDDHAFEALQRFVEATFTRDGDGRPIAIPGAAYGAYDHFFEAEGGFNALVGCNTWTGRALREAGITTGIWTPLPATLFWSLDLHR